MPERVKLAGLLLSPAFTASGKFAALESRCAPAGIFWLTGIASYVEIDIWYVPGFSATTIEQVSRPETVLHPVGLELTVKPVTTVSCCVPVKTSSALLVEGETKCGFLTTLRFGILIRICSVALRAIGRTRVVSDDVAGPAPRPVGPPGNIAADCAPPQFVSNDAAQLRAASLGSIAEKRNVRKDTASPPRKRRRFSWLGASNPAPPEGAQRTCRILAATTLYHERFESSASGANRKSYLLALLVC